MLRFKEVKFTMQLNRYIEDSYDSKVMAISAVACCPLVPPRGEAHQRQAADNQEPNPPATLP